MAKDRSINAHLLAELLSKLAPTDTVSVNTVGNLLIENYQKAYIGWIDLRSEELELLEERNKQP